MLFSPQHINVTQYVYTRKRSPLAVKTNTSKLLKADNVFTSGLYKQGRVYLFTGRERILSMRAEHEGQMYPEYSKPTYYRVNVFNEQTGECRLVNLSPAMMVKVVG